MVKQTMKTKKSNSNAALMRRDDIRSWVETVGASLKKMRDDLSWSQDQVAAEIGISRATLSKLERGKASTGLAVIIAVLITLKSNVWSTFGGQRALAPTNIRSANLHRKLSEILASGDETAITTVDGILTNFTSRLRQH